MARELRTMKARRASVCGQCRREIAVGDTIGQPNVSNRQRGNLYSAMWYCEADARDFQELGPNRAPFLTIADQDNDRARRAPIVARMQARKGAA